jgi:hypothetical protein
LRDDHDAHNFLAGAAFGAAMAIILFLLWRI